MRKGDIVTMNEAALENYGDEWEGVKLQITHKANKYMPAKEFYANGMPEGYHPGYDPSGGSLYDLKSLETGEDLPFSLYHWEVKGV